MFYEMLISKKSVCISKNSHLVTKKHLHNFEKITLHFKCYNSHEGDDQILRKYTMMSLQLYT